MDMGGVLVIVALVIVGAVYFARHRERALRARFLRRVGFGLMALFAGFFGLFLVGETLSDPGGWKGLGLVALWLAPLVGLGLLARFRSDAAGRVLPVLVGAVIGLSVWFALDPSGWRSFEDNNGPIRSVIVFVLAATLAVWGLRRTTRAGVMLLVVGIVPVVLSSFGHGGMASLAAAGTAPVITGLLYVASGYLAGPREPPATPASVEPHPRAA